MEEVKEHIIEMYICEVDHIILQPNQLYRFLIHPNCEKCKKLDVYKENKYGTIFKS